METLKGVEEIGGFKIKRIDWERKPGNEDFHIDVSDKANAITFYIQNGPIKEVGVNGCQVDTIIEATKIIIEGLNRKFPCDENSAAINALGRVLSYLNERERRRELEGNEGHNREREDA